MDRPNLIRFMVLPGALVVAFLLALAAQAQNETLESGSPDIEPLATIEPVPSGAQEADEPTPAGESEYPRDGIWEYFEKANISTAEISLVISVLTASALIFNAYQTRRHNRLSFRPALRLRYRFRGESEFYGVELINPGPGPAIIDDVQLTFRSNKVQPSHAGWKSAFAQAGLSPNDWQMLRPAEGAVIAAGSERWLVYTKPPLKPAANEVVRGLSNISIEIKYRSFYNERQKSLAEPFAFEEFVIGADNVAPES